MDSRGYLRFSISSAHLPEMRSNRTWSAHLVPSSLCLIGIRTGWSVCSTIYKDRLFFTWRNFLYALERKTGKPVLSFGDKGRIDLHNGRDRPPVILTVSASSPVVIFEDRLIHGQHGSGNAAGLYRAG